MIKLRPATIEDLDLVRYWDTKQHVIDCDTDDSWNWEVELKRDPEWREQLIAELNGEPIGFIQIIDPHLEETHYWGEIEHTKRAVDIWIGEERNLNQGYGTKMMELAIDKCFSDEAVNGIFIDPLKSNVKAQRFYKRLGFEFIEERELGGAPCMIYELKRKRPSTSNV